MAGSSNKMAAIFARNSIILGDLDAYCLICSKMLPEGKGAIIHIQGLSHKTCAVSSPEPEYVVKFRDDFIRKMNCIYFCELCDDEIPTITSVNIHVTQESHLQFKSRKFERLGTSILFQDDILITDSAWNGRIEDFCVICDVEFTDYELHKSKPSHILGVIQSRVTIDGENSLYRKLTDGYHCLTCNILLSSNLLKKHLNSPEHFNAIVRQEVTQADDNTKTDESDKNYDIEAEGNSAGEVCAVVAERTSTVCVGVTNGASSSGTDTKTETRKQDEQPSNSDGNTRTDESDKNNDKDAESNGAIGVYADIAEGGVTKGTSSSGTVTNTSQQGKQSSNTDINTKTDDSDKNDDKDAESNGAGGVCADVAKDVTKGTSRNGTDTNTSQQDKQSSNTDVNSKTDDSDKNDDKDAEGNGAGGVCADVAKGGVTKGTSSYGTVTNTSQQGKQSSNTDGNTKTDDSYKNDGKDAEANGAGGVCADVAKGDDTKGTSSYGTVTNTSQQDKQSSNTHINTKTDDSVKNDDKDAEGNGAGGVCADVAKDVTKGTSRNGTDTNTSQQEKPPNTDGNTKKSTTVEDTNKSFSSKSKSQVETVAYDKQFSNTDGNTKTDDSDKNDEKDTDGNGAGGVCADVAEDVTKGTSSNGTDTNTSQQDKPPNTDGNTKKSTTVEDTNKSFTSKSKSQVETVANAKQFSYTEGNTKEPTSVVNTKELYTSKSKSKVEIGANDQQSSNTIGNTKKSARIRKTKKPSPSKPSMVKDTNKPSPSKPAMVKETNELSSAKPAPVEDSSQPSPSMPAPTEEHGSSTSKSKSQVETVANDKPPNTDGNTKKSTTVEDTNKSFTSKSKSQVETVANAKQFSYTEGNTREPTSVVNTKELYTSKSKSKVEIGANDQQSSNTIGNTKKSARIRKTKKPSPSKPSMVKDTNKPSPSKPAMVKETNELSPAKPAPVEDSSQPSPSMPAPIEEHGSSTSKSMSKVNTSSKDSSSFKANLLGVLEELEVFTNAHLPSDKKSSDTNENANTSTAVTENNEPSTSKQKSKIESLVKQHKGLSVAPDGIVYCRLCKIEVLPTTETAVKEHVNKAFHKQKVPSRSDAKDPRIKKKLTRDFVTVEEILEDANGTKYTIINCTICCPNLHYLGFVDCQDKYFCHFCDIDVKTSNEDVRAHLSTPTHSQLLENSYVVTTLKSDFIRQIKGTFFHCGICGIIKSKYDDMLDHVATTLHVQAKNHCKSKQHFFQFRQLLQRCNGDPNNDKIKLIEHFHWK